MTTVYPLVQIISHISVLTPIFTPWQTCAQNLIESNRPSAVLFICKSHQLCPDNNLYKTLQVPSQTIFGLESSNLPTFRETDLVFLVDDRLVSWNNDTVQKYRRQGGSDFKIVIVAKMPDNIHDISKSMKDLFSALWLSGIVKCAVLLVDDTGSQLYTYYPFKDPRLCEDTTPVLLGECSDVLDEVFDMTYKTMNLNQCPIRVATIDERPFFHYKSISLGRLGKLITEVARSMNASIVTVKPASGDHGRPCGLEEDSGSRELVFNGTVHMVAGSFNQQECSTLEYISLAYMQCLSWCTPLIRNKDDIFLLIVRPFQAKVWFALLISAIGVSVVMPFLCTATLERWTSTDAFNLALVVYAQPPPVEPRTTPARLVVIIWLLVCFVVRTAHEGELKSLSSLRKNFYIIETIKELVELDLQMCASSGNVQPLSKFKDHPVVHKILEKIQDCNGSIYENMIAAAKLRDRAIFASDLRCVVVASQLWPQNLYLYPRSGGCYKRYQVSTIITLRGSPFIRRWRMIQDWCVQSGLILKWLDIKFLRKPPCEARPIRVRHLLPALFALGVGCLVALLSFVCEKLFHRRSKHKLLKLARTPIEKEVYNKTIVCNKSLYENIAAASARKDRAVFTSDLRYILTASDESQDGLHLYPASGGCLKTNPISTILTLPGSPFIDRWRTIQDRCTQAGLILKWLNIEPLRGDFGSLRPYSMSLFLPPLFVLAVGCLGGGLIFVCELTLR